jgi:hypothetical protein
MYIHQKQQRAQAALPKKETQRTHRSPPSPKKKHSGHTAPRTHAVLLKGFKFTIKTSVLFLHLRSFLLKKQKARKKGQTQNSEANVKNIRKFHK